MKVVQLSKPSLKSDWLIGKCFFRANKDVEIVNVPDGDLGIFSEINEY